ncbi:MAG TPA: DNA-processing protein DprA [Acidimicrobiales bacterium]|nr:DNA-processing protein DprA [Acidimicrobiales bacterium]
MSAPADACALDRACALALAELPAMTQGRLRHLLSRRSPAAVWSSLSGPPGRHRAAPSGIDARVLGRWRERAASTDPLLRREEYRRQGVDVLVRGASGYPGRLAEDPAAPEVLFVRGDPAVLDAPVVALVGTRSCTGYGAVVARRLGRGLAASGVVVLSGLASGIDAAAHRGALGIPGAPVAGAVPGGLGRVYPAGSADLWEEVPRRGALLSEAPLGARPERWRFRRRNAMVAGLADVVVVVESHPAGGSLVTADLAAERGVTVMAVPGPVTSRASAGTNGLIAAGATLAQDLDDVLMAVGLGGGLRRAAGRSGPVDPPAPAGEGSPGGAGAALLAAVDATPTGLEAVLDRTGLGPVEAAAGLARLVDAGRLRAGPGWWARPG